jgi:UDP-N-acetylmuramoylalanine--D-glutamate ligase
VFSIKGKTIVVIGAKRSGLSLCRLIKRQGGYPLLTDRGPEENVDGQDLAWLKKENIECEFGEHSPEFVGRGDMIVLSPGVPSNSDPVQWAEETGQDVYGEIEFASLFCDKPIIAVTGSNGKTTTTTLIYLVLKEAGYKVCVGGNIGTPFSEFADDPSYDCMVLEVSSFQMETVHPGGFHPHIAVFLNFTQNHLDRHADLEEYFTAKTKIFLNQDRKDFAVLNMQDEMLKEIEAKVNSCIVYFNQKGSGKPKVR